jgi:frataxin-like iron-binding protein CyaY
MSDQVDSQDSQAIEDEIAALERQLEEARSRLKAGRDSNGEILRLPAKNGTVSIQ